MARRKLRAYSWAEREERRHIRDLVREWSSLGIEKLLERVEARRTAAILQRDRDISGMVEEERILFTGRLNAIIAANEEAQEEIRLTGRLASDEPEDDS